MTATRRPPLDFSGQVAIVTGAGSRLSGEVGNGRATAILLARQGAKVGLVDYNADWAEETRKTIDDEGGVGMVIQGDVSKEEDCKRVVTEVAGMWGRVDVLVNIGTELMCGGCDHLGLILMVGSRCWWSTG